MTAQAPTEDHLETLARDLGEHLLERGWRAATAESCTGGWIAQCITAIAGSSDWFEAGLVTYSNQAKINLLGVDPMLIETHGAVSSETASAMAAGGLRVVGADVCVAVTGVAGPTGGSAEKPVGTVWFGFATPRHGVRAILRQFPGNRREIRARTVEFAFDELIRYLR